ncbi:hypothetical protein VNO77_05951 [Canavalia gladiata]|uniref:RIN4 pathogenic type III effector avirulence factor Avr cleavage site domain-containing protein n=1 Tax=Canavalia gladiata TaxID=3824 RepID=A0AAN9N4F1_CANGL
MQHSHVPKFSSWDSDNIPYTAYFDNARKENAIGNPNDPEENPEAFNQYLRGVEKDDEEAVKASTGIHSFSTSSSEQINHEEEKSNSDHSVIQKVKLGLRESMSTTTRGSFSSSSHIKRMGGSHSLTDHAKHEATLVPEFGAWDVTDPCSVEGYTAIFSEIRKEKQIASHHIPTTSKTPSPNNCSNIQSQCATPSSTLSKYCCCLFSSESK